MCHLADAVLAGGIRRAALISLFSADDMEMITCKSGNWWELNPQRGRANNSAVLLRNRITKSFFLQLWKRIQESGSGEPGIYFSNDKDWGTNPCCEIALRPYQFCNLVEINASSVESELDFLRRVKYATLIATMQAGYTDFHYLRDIWKKNTEKDALLGISMTGIASGTLDNYNFEELMEASNDLIRDCNAEFAEDFGINPAARTTCVKPAGTTSLVLGTSSGIHAWHNDYYIRRIRVGKNEAIYNYLLKTLPEIVEDEAFRPHDTAVISIPQKAPPGASTRTENVFEFLERVRNYSKHWVKNGHRDGLNTHNVSATISVKENEWDSVGNWMWNNREYYNGLSVLPYDGGTYTQAPFEDITEEQYLEMVGMLKGLDMTQVIEQEDNTDLQGEIACAGGLCEI
jgi:ribonucleoside-diphosphate reductase alpha chain